MQDNTTDRRSATQRRAERRAYRTGWADRETYEAAKQAEIQRQKDEEAREWASTRYVSFLQKNPATGRLERWDWTPSTNWAVREVA